MINFYNILESTKWQFTFQDPATPIAGRIIEIHNHVFFFLLIILIFVSWMLFRIFSSFWADNVQGRFIPTKPNIMGMIYNWEIRRLFALSQLKLTHNTTIEIIWTLIPSFILVAIAIPSFGLLYAMDDTLDPDMTIKITAHQWYWSYEYSDLDEEIGFDSYMIPESELPVGAGRLLEVDNHTPVPIQLYVRLVITSADVLHSWAVPSLGIKVDAVPMRINAGSIFLERLGTYFGQCSEICGPNHGFMPIAIDAVTVDQFIQYIKDRTTPEFPIARSTFVPTTPVDYRDFDCSSIFSKFVCSCEELPQPVEKVGSANDTMTTTENPEPGLDKFTCFLIGFYIGIFVLEKYFS